MTRADIQQAREDGEYLEAAALAAEDGEMPDCSYCRGSGLSPHSIRDVPCPYCGGMG